MHRKANKKTHAKWRLVSSAMQPTVTDIGNASIISLNYMTVRMVWCLPESIEALLKDVITHGDPTIVTANN